MSPSLVKVLDRKLSEDELNLILIVDVIYGQPHAGDGIYFTSIGDWWIDTERVEKSASGQQHELYFDDHTWTWTHEKEKFVKAVHPVCLCCLTPQEYQKLTIQQKIEYFLRVVDLSGVGRIAAFMRSTARSSVSLIPKEKAGEISLTKMGGLPLAPEGFVFPKDEAGRSALFICQLDIAELNQRFECTKELKGNGILYFFGTIKVTYEGEYHSFGTILVSYSEQITNLTTAPLPDDIQDYGVFEEKDFLVMEEVSIPNEGSSLWEGEETSTEEMDTYSVIEHLLTNHFKTSTFAPGSFEDIFHFLGYPIQIQQCVLLEAERKHMQQGWYHPDYGKEGYEAPDWKQMEQNAKLMARQWRHLFGLDLCNKSLQKLSNFNGEFNKHMDGVFYVMIKQKDLDDMNFTAVEVIYQST